MKRQYDEYTVLRSPFNIEEHKQTFINYLEVVILKDGSIHYAIPSHQQKAIRHIALERNLTDQQVADLCPPEYYLDYNNWLCAESGLIMVWNDFYMGIPNESQIEALLKLTDAGIFHGSIAEYTF